MEARRARDPKLHRKRTLLTLSMNTWTAMEASKWRLHKSSQRAKSFSSCACNDEYSDVPRNSAPSRAGRMAPVSVTAQPHLRSDELLKSASWPLTIHARLPKIEHKQLAPARPAHARNKVARLDVAVNVALL